ncbi:asparaginase [Aneurinibacillus sp. BA2021]|nr:asparaginase [Aneurinibacillus sp. BA2021]
MQEKIIVLNTGGTIAMSVDENTDAVKPGDFHPLHNIEPMLKQYGRVDMKDIFNVPSPHMTPPMMLELSKRIASLLAQPEVTGVVVTHGTDTLEETAYFLDLTSPSDKPIIVTGAMRSSNELGADGPINLVQSVRVAADPQSRERGTLVVFNDEIHAARYVTKTHTSNVATFQSPQHGPIGIVAKKSVQFNQPPFRSRGYEPQSAACNVPLIKMVTGFDPLWLECLLSRPLDGLVLEAFGAGNVPPAVLPLLREIIARGIPVVMVSRCYNGYVQDLYGYEGGGVQLKEMGVIFCNGLNGQKARIHLIIALQSGVAVSELSSHFASSV